MSDDIRYDVEAERATLGMVLNGADPDQVAKLLNADDFYQPRHVDLWRTITAVHEAGEPVTTASVGKALIRGGVKHDPLYLVDLVGSAPMVGDLGWYAQRVADEAQFRTFAAAGMQIQQVAHDRGRDIAEVRQIARAAIDDASSAGEVTKHVRVSDVLPEVIDMADKGTAPTLSTPWPDVDRLIGGLAPGRLIVVGARPGGGKSLMGTNLALHFASRHRHAVLIASMEMDRVEVTQRLVSAHARVDVRHLSDAQLTEPEWDSLRGHHDEISAMPITIDDAATQTVAGIRAAAREIQRERDDLSLIVVDYLQLMQAPEVDRRANRSEVIGSISRGLKILARESGACVVAMAQVNREGVKGGARPTMGDLRESGAIESDANQVILLHRPDEDVPDIDVIVDKNRHGIKGVAQLRLRGHYSTLSNLDWRDRL